MKKSLLISLLLLFSFQIQASDEKFSVGFHIGDMNMDIQKPYRFTADGDDMSSLGLFLRYRPANNLIIDLDTNSSIDFGIFVGADVYSLNTTDLMLGYELYWKKLKFTPKLGLSRWSLVAEEGPLFNPGPEETRELDGYDLTGGILTSFVFNSRFELGFSYKLMNPKFGRVDFTQLEFIVNF